MTQRLDEAIACVQQLPMAEQDAIAQLILDELADDQRWDEAFARSQDARARLAAQVRADIHAWNTGPPICRSGARTWVATMAGERVSAESYAPFHTGFKIKSCLTRKERIV